MYEYLVISAKNEDVSKTLNEKAAAGWRIVQIIPWYISSNLIFERPKEVTK